MPKLLLVDDEPNIRWAMSEMLRREGYEALAAGDFETALAIIDGSPLDAAIIDINLPKRSGLELLAEMQTRHPGVPVIVITGEPNTAQIPQLLRLGAFDYIAKPVHSEGLIAAVSKAVERRRLLEQKGRLEEEIKHYAQHLESLVRERTGELAEAHNFLNAILDSSTEYAIICFDRDERVTLFNTGAELMFGFRERQMLGKIASNLCSPQEGRDSPLRLWAKRAAQEGRFRAGLSLRRADASEFVACVTLTPIRGEQGELLGFLAVIRDETLDREREKELNEMQRRLAHNEKMSALGRMAAQVAHEVKNPLAGLRLYAMHLRDKVAGRLSSNESELLDKILDGINHLSGTAERVMNFASPLVLSRLESDINRIVTDAVQLLQPQISASGIRARLHLKAGEIVAPVDEPSMRSALLNLMLNAVQSMPGGGILSVITADSEDAVNIVLADTGRGMTRDQLRNAFEPFFTTRSQGLGLGMPYARKVIEQHGGKVNLASHAGAGTCISIEIPRKDRTRDDLTTESAHSRRRASSDGRVGLNT